MFFNGQYADHYRTLPLIMGSVPAAGYNNLDASMLKNFPISCDGSRYLQLRIEAFNALDCRSEDGSSSELDGFHHRTP